MNDSAASPTLRPPALVIVALFAGVVAGCAAPSRPINIEIIHVHGLHYSAENDSLFVATHHGLAKGERHDQEWSWAYVGAERYDYMGFTADGVRSGVFYSSGHPDNPYDYGGTRLGLRRSVDFGTTWEQRSLKGEVDFHALTSVPGVEGGVIGWWNGHILSSGDGGLTWTQHDGPPSVPLALAATNSSVWAATENGLYQSGDGLQSWQSRGGPSGAIVSVVVSLDAKTMMLSVLSDRSGVYVSNDGGILWQRASKPALRDIEEPVQFAIDATDSSHAFASTAAARIFETQDGGATWTTVRR